MNTVVEQGNVRCGVCKEFIPGVMSKSSLVMTALNYPDRWDDDMEVLLCDDCRTQSIAAKAWLKHADIRTCIKVGRNCQ